MKRKVKFQEGGEVEAPPPRRQSAISNEPVGARFRRGLERLFGGIARPGAGGGGPRGMAPRMPRRPAPVTTPEPEAAQAAPPVEVRQPPSQQETRARRAAPAPREISADRLNELAMGAEPANVEERLAQMRIVRRLREMVEASPRMEQTAPAPARMESAGGSGDIGAASARARGEQVGPPGDYNFKRGGMVKPKTKAMKTGGKVPAPKKMMKGGVVAKPKSKAKPMAKPMPAFKKGGVIKKGRK